MAQVTPPVPPADDAAATAPKKPRATKAATPAVPVVPAIPAAPTADAVPVAPTGVTEPVVAPAGADYAAVAAVPGKRRIWPFVLGGAVLLLILIIVGVSLAIGAILNAVGDSSSPSATVIAFDDSFKRTDCTLFQSTTTPGFQASYFDEGFSCDQWEPIAEGLHDNGVYHYTVVVNDTKINGNSADVTTSEKDTTPGAEESYELDYRLLKSNGGWLIDSITNIG
jgi:hypothetical protein